MIEESYIAQLEKKYPDYLRKVISNEVFEKIRLRGGLKKPDNQTELHTSIKSFQKYEKKEDRPGWEISWEPWKSRRVSDQRWPTSIAVTTEQDYLFILKKEEEAASFKTQLKQLISWNYQITGWLIDRPLMVLKYRADWKGICEVTDFILKENVSVYFSRNLPVAVHTKFIDQYQSVILSLLKHLDPERFPEGVKDLATAAGLRIKPHLYPLHWLDEALAARYTAGFNILALPFATLQKMEWNVSEVWIVENETNLYLLQPRKNALAVFAKGYALHLLKQIPFFRQARLLYWGDLDEDGFCMLEQFREHYGHTESLLMDEETVFFHKDEIETINYRFHRPTLKIESAELKGYLLLLEKTGRIEQEKLQQDFVQNYIKSHLPA